MKNLKTFLLICLLIFNAEAAFAGFKVFPTIGMCTATNVRVRENPDTSEETKVIDRLDSPERVIVLSQTFVEGQVWYEIDMSLKNSKREFKDDYEEVESACVYGKYVTAFYDEDFQDENIIKFLVYLTQNAINDYPNNA